MTTKAVTIRVLLPASVKLSQDEARELLVLRLLDEGRLSQTQAAKALALTRHELLDLMARHRVPVVRYARDEWAQEGA